VAATAHCSGLPPVGVIAEKFEVVDGFLSLGVKELFDRRFVADGYSSFEFVS
jgi:hypothetical protein